jgi:hypothetical protein
VSATDSGIPGGSLRKISADPPVGRGETASPTLQIPGDVAERKQAAIALHLFDRDLDVQISTDVSGDRPSGEILAPTKRARERDVGDQEIQ